MDRTGGTSADVDLSQAEPADIKNAVFATARQLHAEQAPRIISDPLYDTDQYLLDDEELRTDLADLIGQIAESHNWSLAKVEQRIPQIQGAPGYLPPDWKVNPLKIACLLRCADAIQIDQRRTPHFQLALHNPTGYSRLHWLAQQMAQPVVEVGSEAPGKLIFTSQRNFALPDADAWWVAYDLISLANKELGDCYQFMKNRAIPIFIVDRIDVAGDPSKLAVHIRTTGWSPVKAEVKISDVDNIVRLFGGFGLYGHDLIVPLRELIQNASDAIRARRVHEEDEAYRGRIDVSISDPDADGIQTLSVEDNGIGMSEGVLVGPLLEFGKSFWNSDALMREFPGLISSKISQVGRYGIGFFSVFMVSDHITVTSVNCKSSRESVKSLIFRDALKLRPIIAPAQTPMRASVNTKIELRVKRDRIESMMTVFDREQRERDNISLPDLIAHLCPTLDCDVYVKYGNQTSICAHQQQWAEGDKAAWLDKVILNSHRKHDTISNYFSTVLGNLAIIPASDGTPIGLAAINTTNGSFGLDNIGGFAAGGHSRSVSSMSEAYIGSLRREPDGPRRGAGTLLPSSEAIAAWASDQAVKLSEQDVLPGNKYIASMNICMFGGDPLPIATALLNRDFVSIEAVADMLISGEDVFTPVNPRREEGELFEIDAIMLEISSHHRSYLRPDELHLYGKVLEAWNVGSHREKRFHLIGIDQDMPNSLTGCLYRLCAQRGFSLNFEPLGSHTFGKYTGPSSERDKIESGKEIIQPALKLTVSKHK
ncbi:hypothetical protein CRT23_25280 [Methylobacterium sp. V23]|nr:hypothetical protein CRT23_25280 [Methylobacterium sp. V23]